MHSFEVHSNESAHRKSGHLGLDQVLSALTGFLRGKQNYTTHTDTNHNTKPSRYQLVIGGNDAETIGIYIIDSGSLK